MAGRGTHDGRVLERLDALAARRWALAARAVLGARRREIDAINVFPVPDGDTGTNLYLTLDSAIEAAGDGATADAPPRTLAEEASALARATLLAARGNSGVILSQLVRGLSEVVAEESAAQPAGGMDGPALARAIRRASDLARASVTRPVEGTILSVAAAAADAAEQAAGSRMGAAVSRLYAVAHAALVAAREALVATTAQLPALGRVGVVDAGGAGLVLVLEALERVVSGASTVEILRGSDRDPGSGWHPAGQPMLPDGGREASGPAYEVMYLLSDTSAEQVATMRAELDRLGDSLLVVGSGDLWNVHVHVDDVGAAIEAGIAVGRPHRIAVTHFGDRRGHRRTGEVSASAVVACVTGDGLVEVFRDAGAAVVDAGQGRRPSAAQILAAVREAHALSVLVLPDDAGTRPAAEAAAAAAAEDGIDAHVVPSGAAVQGMAALAVFDSSAPAAENLVRMSAAAASTRAGAVTEEAHGSEEAHLLGLVDGEVVSVGTDLVTVAREVVDRLLDGGGELLTVVTGAGTPPGMGAALAEAARGRRRDLEVTLIAGGRTASPVLLGME